MPELYRAPSAPTLGTDARRQHSWLAWASPVLSVLGSTPIAGLFANFAYVVATTGSAPIANRAQSMMMGLVVIGSAAAFLIGLAAGLIALSQPAIHRLPAVLGCCFNALGLILFAAMLVLDPR